MPERSSKDPAKTVVFDGTKTLPPPEACAESMARWIAFASFVNPSATAPKSRIENVFMAGRLGAGIQRGLESEV